MSDGRILKINVIVDENGTAERKLDTLDKKVDGLGDGANKATAPVDRLSRSVGGLGDESQELNASLQGTNASFGAGVPLVGGYTAAVLAAGAAAAVLVTGATALAGIIKESTEYYIEQSGVLEVNRSAVDRLADTWDRVRYAIGQATLGTSGDFTSWIDLVNGGLALMGSHLAAGIEFYKELGRLAADFAAGGPVGMITGASRGMPDVDTRLKNADGSPTAFGYLQQNQNRFKDRMMVDDATFGVGGFERAMQETARMKQEQAEADRELVRLQKEQERAAEANVRMHARLVEELHRVEEAGRQAFDVEIASSFMRQLGQIQGVSEGIRDNFAELVLSGNELKQFNINERADRALAGVDDRAENAGVLRQRIEAQRELEQLMLRKDTEGPSDGLHLDVMIFAEKYAEVIGDLPKTLQGIVPEMAAASGEIRDTMTSDFESVGQSAEQTFVSIDNRLRSSAELMDAYRLKLFDAEENLKRGNPFGIADRQFEAAGLIKEAALKAQRREAFVGFETGGIVPQYFGIGGYARGTDTVPAMLTPGEGVLSLRGMEALDRLNRGGGVGGGISISIDARGAQFTDERQLEVLADKVQQKLHELGVRVAG